MLETLISIASTVGPVLSAANSAFGLYKNISAIRCGGSSTEHYLDELAAELGDLRLEVKRLSDNILYLPKVEGVTNVIQMPQQSIKDLREVRKYLDPIQQAIGQDIVSSRMIFTPNRLLQAMRANPRDVLYNIRSANDAEPSTDPSLVPVLFQDRGVAYIGWIKRGTMSAIFGCEYNELWLPGSKQSQNPTELPSEPPLFPYPEPPSFPW